MFRTQLFILAVMAIGVGATAQATPPGSTALPPPNNTGFLTVPCSNDPDGLTYQRKCADVINGVPGQNGYSGPTGIVPALDATIQKLADDSKHSLYTGEVVDQSSDANNPKTEYFGRATCDLMTGPIVGGAAEEITNHHGESCGTPARITVTCSRSSGVHTLIDMNKPYGTEEGAYTRGMWIQALTCYWQQVHNEIKNNMRIKISPGCTALSKSIGDMGSRAENIFMSLKGNLGTSANIAELNRCAQDVQQLEKADGVANNGAESMLRQGVQYLCAARAGLEGLFAQMAVCEVFARAGASYREVLTDPETFLDEIRDKVGETCNHQCKMQCAGVSSEGSCAQCGTTCGNQCFPVEARKFFLDKMKKWPSNGSCQ